jgi:hypothetical protein
MFFYVRCVLICSVYVEALRRRSPLQGVPTVIYNPGLESQKTVGHEPHWSPSSLRQCDCEGCKVILSVVLCLIVF